jgi:hypothetical protein
MHGENIAWCDLPGVVGVALLQSGCIHIACDRNLFLFCSFFFVVTFSLYYWRPLCACMDPVALSDPIYVWPIIKPRVTVIAGT